MMIQSVRKKFNSELNIFGYSFGNHDGNSIIKMENISFNWTKDAYIAPITSQLSDDTPVPHNLADINFNYLGGKQSYYLSFRELLGALIKWLFNKFFLLFKWE